MSVISWPSPTYMFEIWQEFPYYFLARFRAGGSNNWNSPSLGTSVEKAVTWCLSQGVCVHAFYFFFFLSFTIQIKFASTKWLTSHFILYSFCGVLCQGKCSSLLVLALCFSHTNENGSEKDNGPGLRRPRLTQDTWWSVICRCDSAPNQTDVSVP